MTALTQEKLEAGDEPAYARARDERVAATCAAVIEANPGRTVGGGWAPDAVLAAVAKIAHAGLQVRGSRHHALRQQIACYTACYGRFFAPSAPTWALTGVAGQQLTWTHASGAVLVDALRCAHEDDVLLPPRLRGWLNTTWKTTPNLVAIRVLALAAPLASRAWTSAGRLAPLTDLCDLISASTKDWQ